MEPIDNIFNRLQEIEATAHDLYTQGRAIDSLDKKIKDKALEVLMKKIELKFPYQTLFEKNINYLGAKQVTFSDGALNCSLPGDTSMTSLVEGYSLKFSVNNEIYHVHTDGQKSYRVPEANLALYSDGLLVAALSTARVDYAVKQIENVEVKSVIREVDYDNKTKYLTIYCKINDMILSKKVVASDKEFFSYSI